MDDLLALGRLTASGVLAAAIIYAGYRGLRWRFPRLGARRSALIVTLGVVVLASFSFTTLRTGGVGCVQHENTVLLRGERIINIRGDETAPPRPPTAERTARVRDSCAYLDRHCPLDTTDSTRTAAREICLATPPGTG
jgi:hypothetical protein